MLYLFYREQDQTQQWHISQHPPHWDPESLVWIDFKMCTVSPCIHHNPDLHRNSTVISPGVSWMLVLQCSIVQQYKVSLELKIWVSTTQTFHLLYWSYFWKFDTFISAVLSMFISPWGQSHWVSLYCCLKPIRASLFYTALIRLSIIRLGSNILWQANNK